MSKMLIRCYKYFNPYIALILLEMQISVVKK